MSTWVLVFYMSTGWFNNSTGGPAAINGLQSKEQCEKLLLTVKTLRHFDWGQCIEAKP
jgi:hypothetical protein